MAAVTVRVRPAFAGEGRYFVLVPLGTIKEEMMQFDDDTEIDEEDRQDMLVSASPYIMPVLERRCPTHDAVTRAKRLALACSVRSAVATPPPPLPQCWSDTRADTRGHTRAEWFTLASPPPPTTNHVVTHVRERPS